MTAAQSCILFLVCLLGLALCLWLARQATARPKLPAARNCLQYKARIPLRYRLDGEPRDYWVLIDRRGNELDRRPVSEGRWPGVGRVRE